jgi:hypothetical protein
MFASHGLSTIYNPPFCILHGLHINKYLPALYKTDIIGTSLNDSANVFRQAIGRSQTPDTDACLHFTDYH